MWVWGVLFVLIVILQVGEILEEGVSERPLFWLVKKLEARSEL